MAEPVWHWLYYRNRPRVLVEGEEAYQAAIRRKVPKLLHHHRAAIHTCDACGRRGPWDNWTSIVQRTAWRDDDRDAGIRFIACSAACRKTRPIRDSEIATSCEPGYDVSLIWRITADDRAAQRRIRTLPMPVFPRDQTGYGWCRWCGREILHTDGKRKGQRHKQRLWHPRCKDIWLLHYDSGEQWRFLGRRDGLKCAICPSTPGRWRVLQETPTYTYIDRLPLVALEVDHVVPLWKVAHLPDDERRVYFGPDNLWLLCHEHHKEKSRWEAADRAAFRQARVLDDGHDRFDAQTDVARAPD